jgi:UDP-glucose 4-epimerase
VILITGGFGFIGAHTARALLDLGECCLLTRYRTSRAPDFFADQIGKRIIVEDVDYTNRVALLALGERHEITSIIHPLAPNWAPLA